MAVSWFPYGRRCRVVNQRSTLLLATTWTKLCLILFGVGYRLFRYDLPQDQNGVFAILPSVKTGGNFLRELYDITHRFQLRAAGDAVHRFAGFVFISTLSVVGMAVDKGVDTGGVGKNVGIGERKPACFLNEPWLSQVRPSALGRPPPSEL